MLQLSDRWAARLISQGESGMGYQVATVILRDGQRLDGALIVGGVITRISGRPDIPFGEADIADIVVTHDKRYLAAGPKASR